VIKCKRKLVSGSLFILFYTNVQSATGLAVRDAATHIFYEELDQTLAKDCEKGEFESLLHDPIINKDS
jgi:hypothetical protein